MSIKRDELYDKLVVAVYDEGGMTHHVVGHRKKAVCLGSLTSWGKADQFCETHAGLDTNHKGQGACKFHGGLNWHNIPSPTFSNGRYAGVSRGRLREKLTRLNDDPDLLNLLPDVMMMRSLLEIFIEDNQHDLNARNIKFIYQAIEHTALLVERIERINDKHPVTATSSKLMMTVAVDVMRQFLGGMEIVQFMKEWEARLVGPLTHSTHVPNIEKIIEMKTE